MDWLYLPLIFLSIITIATGRCMFEECSNTYNTAMDHAGIAGAEKSEAFCNVLHTYQKCMSATSAGCRGDLNYHGTKFGVDRLDIAYCRQNVTTTPKLRPFVPPSNPCSYFGSFKFRHCGLFGDPHLKTFDGVYQTCRARGVWTLIDNTYMRVQVTNKPVLEDAMATAPTKISIVVKGKDTPCTLEKRYEANVEHALPATFHDGTERSGTDETVTLKVRRDDEREHAEIVIKYIATKLIVRRVGKYLAFSAKIPEEVIQTSTYDEQRVELCTTGCPIAEQLDIVSARGHRMDRERALHLCQSTENLPNELVNNLTDSYLDWCVFDVMTAGPAYEFIVAAHSAQSDAINLDLASIKNRTTLLEIPSSNIRFNGANSVGISFLLMAASLIRFLLM